MALISASSSLIQMCSPIPLRFRFPFKKTSFGLSRRSSKPSRSVPRSLKCFSQRQPTQEFERLFSNLNQATMKREPGSVTSGIFLLAPRWSYIFIHYALLVAYVACSSEILTNNFSIPLYEDSYVGECYLIFVGFGGICYLGSQQFIGAINGFLVFGIIVSFASLVGVAAGNLQWNSLLQAHFEPIPQSTPIITLAFVYQNVVPVLCTNLEGDLPKVRTAVVIATAIPLGLFLIWDAVILGTIPNLNTSDAFTDPLQQLCSDNGVVGPIIEVFSFFAIATSYIGFVLGLTDFLSGFLMLLGVIPAAMSWSERDSKVSVSPKIPPLVPGGKYTLVIVMGGALFVIFSEILKDIVHQWS